MLFTNSVITIIYCYLLIIIIIYLFIVILLVCGLTSYVLNEYVCICMFFYFLL